MAKQFLSGVPFPGVKGGRRAYKWAKTRRSIPRKIQRYFGLGRYEAAPRIAKIAAKTLIRPSQTKRGLQITGISSRGKRAMSIAGKLEAAHKRRRIGAVAWFYGGVAGFAYTNVQRHRKKVARAAQAKKRRK